MYFGFDMLKMVFGPLVHTLGPWRAERFLEELRNENIIQSITRVKPIYTALFP
jgi:L-serine dehydratase